MLTVDKVKPIRADLVQMDNGWQEWKFLQLFEAWESYAQSNRITSRESKIQKYLLSKQVNSKLSVFTATKWTISQRNVKSKIFFRPQENHKWEKVMFKINCTGTKHSTADYRSNRNSLLCKCKYHMFLWNFWGNASLFWIEFNLSGDHTKTSNVVFA